MRRVFGAALVVAALLAVPAAALGVCFEDECPPLSEVTADGSSVGFNAAIYGE